MQQSIDFKTNVITQLFAPSVNALQTTIISNDTTQTIYGNNLFEVKPMNLAPINQLTFENPSPMFNVSLVGLEGTQPFMIDFGTNGIVVWDINCVYSGVSCFQAPINAVGGFDPSVNPKINRYVGSFNNMQIPGFGASGSTYLSELTI